MYTITRKPRAHRQNSLCGLRHLNDGQRVVGPERLGRDGLPRGPVLERGVMAVHAVVIAVTTAAAAVHHQVVGGHLHGHNVLRERPDHLPELVDLVAQVSHADVALVQPVLQPGDVLVFFPGLGHAAGQLALQVPQPVHHGRAHLARGPRSSIALHHYRPQLCIYIIRNTAPACCAARNTRARDIRYAVPTRPAKRDK